MESITQFHGKQPWIVEVETANGDGVVLKHTVICHVDDRRGDLPSLTDLTTGRYVESSVYGEGVALVRALA